MRLTDFTVRTGNQAIRVRAGGPFEAAIKAVKTGKFKAIGWLIEVKRKRGETHYCDALKVVQEAGMLR